MSPELKDIVARYVEKKGISHAMKSSIDGIEALFVTIASNVTLDPDNTLEVAKFKMAIIEYLYFHDDTEEKAIQLGEELLK